MTAGRTAPVNNTRSHDVTFGPGGIARSPVSKTMGAARLTRMYRLEVENYCSLFASRLLAHPHADLTAAAVFAPTESARIALRCVQSCPNR